MVDGTSSDDLAHPMSVLSVDERTSDWDSAPTVGRLHVKVVEARRLFVPAPAKGTGHKRPYSVVEFDKNQVVTREAIALNQLSPEESVLAIEEDSQSHGGHSRAHEEGLWMSPVWKHEASLGWMSGGHENMTEIKANPPLADFKVQVT
ncbi:hypothetical protein BC830DRAFT_504532 [Chytriomyces sp. MP71]|nr:hypothetical protein BC830DRAFT_504532 [Chytriomyces sp. MP71]